MSAQFVKYAVVASAVILGLSACGDESTVSGGGSNVSIFDEKLGECSESNQGAMAYVTDSAALYFCADGEWVPLKGQDGEDGKDGKDGENGKNGEDGKKGDKGDKGDNGDNGTSCTAEIINEGIEVSCGGEVLDTLRNGKSSFELAESELSLEDWLASLKGDKGDKGDNGTSCSIRDKGNGVVKLVCGDNSVNLKEPLCGSTPYDPEEWICLDDDELLQNTASSTATSSAAAPITSSASYSSEAAPSSSASVPSSSAAPSCEETVKGTYTDTRDDHEYKTVTIGDRTWFAENIQYSASSFYSKVHTDGEQRVYYGGEGVCPEGWRLPSRADFEDLIARATCGGTGDPSKVLRSTTWDGTDELGFSVVPTGNCGSSDCWNPDKYTAFWTADLLSFIGSTKTYTTLAFDYADDDPNKRKMFLGEATTAYAVSIRCVKDKE